MKVPTLSNSKCVAQSLPGAVASLLCPRRPQRVQKWGIACLLTVALALAWQSHSHWYDKKRQQQEQTTVAGLAPGKAYAIASLHFSTVLLGVTWIWLLPPFLDPIFIIGQLARLLSYHTTKGECPLTYYEKVYLVDPRYVRGSDPYWEPYTDNLPWQLRFALIVIILAVAPYVVLTVMLNAVGCLRSGRTLGIVISIAFTLWAFKEWLRFAMGKLPRVLAARHDLLAATGEGFTT
jgi:hypothetical protein